MKTTASRAAERQAPLRARYETDPAAAVITKHVSTVADGGDDPFHGTVTPGPYGLAWPYGIDGKVGGFDDAPNPGELLCAALAACLDSTFRIVADHLGVQLDRVTVDVEGEVDVRGALVVTPGVQVGFGSMSAAVSFEASPDTEPRLLDILRAQVERSCITLDTLRTGVPVDLTWHG